MSATRTDLYTRITDRIVADLEHGVRPWHRPWSAGNVADKITRPLRHNGIRYQGINVVMLWSASVVRGYGSPLWLTFRQAHEVGGHVKKSERGELVVYADRIRRTATNDKGEETEQEIPFLRGYTVFNAEQCDDLPAITTPSPRPRSFPSDSGLTPPTGFSLAPVPTSARVERAPTTPKALTTCRCRCSRRSSTRKAMPPRWGTNASTGRSTVRVWRATWAA